MKPWVVFYRYVYKLLLHIFMKKKRNMVTHFFIICSFNVHLKYSSLHFPGFMHENCLNSNHRGTREKKMEEYFEIGKNIWSIRRTNLRKCRRSRVYAKQRTLSQIKARIRQEDKCKKLQMIMRKVDVQLHCQLLTYPFNMEVSAIILCEEEGGLQKWGRSPFVMV